MKKNVGIFSVGLFFSWYIDWLLNEKSKKNKWLVVKGWHVHHSIYGLALAAAAGIVPLIPSKKVRVYQKALQKMLLAVGAGVVAEHTATEGLKFIEKETENDRRKRLHHD